MMDELISKVISFISAFIKTLGYLVIILGTVIFLGYVTIPIFTQSILIIALGVLMTLIEVKEKEGD